MIGLIHAAEGDLRGAHEWLWQARSRATRVSDPYEWVHGHVLDAMGSFAIDADDDQAAEIAQALKELAARAGMRELAVRAHLHEARLGVPGALEAAIALSAEIDNPALDEVLRATASA